jgi:hypothetical protein
VPVRTPPYAAGARGNAVRHRLREIAATAATDAEALDPGRCGFLAPELARQAGALDALRERPDAACERVAVGVGPVGEERGMRVP